MKRFFPVPAILLGLGSIISIAQTSPPQDPFDRYLLGIKSGKPQHALVQFATDCGIDLGVAPARYATRPENEWKATRDLSNAHHELETDFFATVAVRVDRDKALVEVWTMELDVGSESHTLYCLNRKRVTAIEDTEWTLPVTNEEAKTDPGWGYKQRWELENGDRPRRVYAQFVDPYETPKREPSLDIETRKKLDWEPQVREQKDLELPLWLWK